MSPNKNLSFFTIATDRSIVTRAARISLVVGTVLAIINQGDHIVSGQFDKATLSRILLTFMVPYCVSTYSSFLAVRDNLQKVVEQDTQ